MRALTAEILAGYEALDETRNQELHHGPIWGSAPSMPDEDLDVTVAAGSIETGALRAYLNVRRRANLWPAHSWELALKLFEVASWVENHSID